MLLELPIDVRLGVGESLDDRSLSVDQLAPLRDTHRAEPRSEDLVDQAGRSEDDLRAAAADVRHRDRPVGNVERPGDAQVGEPRFFFRLR